MLLSGDVGRPAGETPQASFFPSWIGTLPCGLLDFSFDCKPPSADALAYFFGHTREKLTERRYEIDENSFCKDKSQAIHHRMPGDARTLSRLSFLRPRSRRAGINIRRVWRPHRRWGCGVKEAPSDPPRRATSPASARRLRRSAVENLRSPVLSKKWRPHRLSRRWASDWRLGARLDLVYDLTVTKAPQATPPGTSGTIAGSVDLTPAHVDALKAGKLYIQINSEGAPNGHLLGWLLK